MFILLMIYLHLYVLAYNIIIRLANSFIYAFNIANNLVITRDPML